MHDHGRTGGALRIAHLTTADISLALLLATELAEAMKEGHEVFGLSAPGPYVPRVEDLGVRHVPIPGLTRSWSLRQDARAFMGLWRTLRRLDLDVLHTHNPKTGVMGRIAGRLAGIPVVVNTCHGLWATPQDPLRKRALVYTLEGLAARFSDFELFQNAQDEATLTRFLRPGRHRVVGNGVDLERFRFDPMGRERLRAEWGVADDEIVIGTVGRRVREKGLLEFAHAAAALGDRARFVWVGPEDETERDQAVGEGLEAVQFVGEQIDMPAVYSAFDIFTLASYREGFSRASMEAAACARPLVLTDIRGCREIGRAEEHVLFATPRDAPSLTQNLTRLLDDDALRHRLGAAAADRARPAFDQREIARISRETYDSVRRRKGSGTAPPRRTKGRRTVLHVLPADMDRGAQVYALQLRDALAGDSDQRHIVLSIFDEPGAARSSDVRLRVSSGPMRRLGLDPRAVGALRSAVRSLQADLLVAHGGEALKYVVASAGAIPTVYYKVGLSSAELRRLGRRSLYRLLAARAAAVVAVSGAVGEQCRTVLRVPEAHVQVIPNGRDPSVYQPGSAAERAVPPLMLWVGRLETGKRPELFLDVVEDLRARRVPFQAMLVGDGPLLTDLRSRAAALGVELTGSRDDIPALLRTAGLVVMTSSPDTEGMPGVLVEAGLASLPVVSTNAAGVADVVEHGRSGYIVSSDSAAELADAAELLLSDAQRRHEFGRRGRDRCATRFSILQTARRWKDLVAQLVPGERGRSGPQLEASFEDTAVTGPGPR